MAARYRTLIEAPEFAAQLDFLTKLYPAWVIEPTLMGLLWGIATNPQEYDRATWNIRVAKSRSFGSVPKLVIFFQVQSENEVLLLWIDEERKIEELLE